MEVGGIRDQAAVLARRVGESGVSEGASVGRSGGMERVEEKAAVEGAGTPQDLLGEGRAGAQGQGEEAVDFGPALDRGL